MMIGSRQQIAQAIQDIQKVGRVTEQTMHSIQRAAGPSSEEIIQLIESYRKVAARKRIFARRAREAQQGNQVLQ
ncbi:MAG: hypothetical protein KatS3mg087_1804 [Patescibacteria group bacterium]|nr:MAG: hypothetical protein KatS3mg087_1804 [Patescibacteria group bacterium]